MTEKDKEYRCNLCDENDLVYFLQHDIHVFTIGEEGFYLLNALLISKKIIRAKRVSSHICTVAEIILDFVSATLRKILAIFINGVD